MKLIIAGTYVTEGDMILKWLSDAQKNERSLIMNIADYNLLKSGDK